MHAEPKDYQNQGLGGIVFRNEMAIEYREAAVDAVFRGGRGVGVLRTESDALQRRLAAESAVDSVLADSFPASDPPSWTLGITHPPPEGQATNVEITLAPDARRAALVRENMIAVSRLSGGRTFLKGLVSLAGAAGLVLLLPFAILLIGLPIAFAVRGVAEMASWLLALVFG
jgi:hypothetical protein